MGNRISELNLSSEVTVKLMTMLNSNTETKRLALCELINEYFQFAKRGFQSSSGLGASFDLDFGLNWMMKDDETKSDTINQTALYMNLYPNSYKKIKADVIEFFSGINLNEFFEWFEPYAKTQDGAYEAMLRQRGVVEPF